VEEEVVEAVTLLKPVFVSKSDRETLAVEKSNIEQ
jgi:hypothetical protein